MNIPHKKIHEWQKTAAELARLKEKEAQLRREIVAQCSNPDKKKGTENIELGKGFKLKMVKKINTYVDEATLDYVKKKLPEGTLDQTIKYKPEFKVTGFNALSEKHQKLLRQALTEKDGMPELSIIEPKNK